MDGLEAVEIKLSECKNIIDFRIDANTYKKEYIKTSEILKNIGSVPIQDIMLSIQNFGAYSLCNDISFCEEGIPFLMTQNIQHNYIDWNSVRYIDETSHTLLHKSHCKINQVLVTMAGEYLGRVAVYNRDFVSSSNQAIAKITLKDGINPYYISTFLNTKYGQNQINRLKTITGQPNINMGLIQSLNVAVLKDDVINQIEKIVVQSEILRQQAKEGYESAETALLQYLGLESYNPHKSGMAVKSYSSSFGVSGRLDSEYYQPKYEEILNAVSARNHKKLGVIVNINKSIEPGSDYYGDEGVPFIRVSNLSKYELSEPDIKIPFDTVKNISDLYPKKDTILLSKDGSVGIAYKVENDMQLVTSGAILHLVVINPHEILPDFLTLVLNSKVVQMQAERDAGGSIIQHWKPTEIASVIIPVLDENQQLEISAKVKESFTLRKKAVALLELAKAALEVAIEQGEDEAMAMLKGGYNGKL